VGRNPTLIDLSYNNCWTPQLAGRSSLGFRPPGSALTGLSVADGAYLLSLDLFSEQDARELLQRRLGAGRISAETEAAGEVIRLCGYLPLSLSIAAARAAARPAQPLAAQAAKLRNAQTRLDGLSTGDATTDPRAVFSWS
jgi:hypothetical protein